MVKRGVPLERQKGYHSPTARRAPPVRGKGPAHLSRCRIDITISFRPDGCGLQALLKGDSCGPQPAVRAAPSPTPEPRALPQARQGASPRLLLNPTAGGRGLGEAVAPLTVLASIARSRRSFGPRRLCSPSGAERTSRSTGGAPQQGPVRGRTDPWLRQLAEVRA